MDFKYFWNKQRKQAPDEPSMISLCAILQHSGETKKEIEKIFDTYMPKDEFFPDEKKEMVDYLFKISKD